MQPLCWFVFVFRSIWSSENCTFAKSCHWGFLSQQLPFVMAVVLSRTKSHNKNTTRLSRFNVLVLPLISILLVLFNLRLTGFVGDPTWTYQEDVISPAFAPPRRFSDNVQLNIDRGLNIINMFSPIHLAGWIYLGEKTRSNEPKVSHAKPRRDHCYLTLSAAY